MHPHQHLNATWPTREEISGCTNPSAWKVDICDVSGLGEALIEHSIGQTTLGPVTSCSLTSDIIVKSNEGRFPRVQTEIQEIKVSEAVKGV